MIRDSIDDAIPEILGGEEFVQTEHIKAAKAKYTGIFLREGDLNLSREDLDRVDYNSEDLKSDLYELAERTYKEREEEFGSEVMRELERVILLRSVDEHWMDHIDAMSELRRGIGLRAYAQHDPVIAYKNESFDMFEEMVASIRETTVRQIFTFRLKTADAPKREAVAKITNTSGDGTEVRKSPRRVAAKVGRNDPCPCGSGKKYKKCCGANE